MNTQRTDGRYMVKVYIGSTDGKKQFKFVYGKTQKEADRKAEELKVSLRKGIDISASNNAFKTWAEYWLTSKRYEVSADRYSTLQSRSAVWIDAIGTAQINQIKPFEFFTIAAKNPYTGAPMARKTLGRCGKILKSLLLLLNN